MEAPSERREGVLVISAWTEEGAGPHRLRIVIRDEGVEFLESGETGAGGRRHAFSSIDDACNYVRSWLQAVG